MSCGYFALASSMLRQEQNLRHHVHHQQVSPPQPLQAPGKPAEPRPVSSCSWLCELVIIQADDVQFDKL
jgi:hypothetical protein